MSRKELSINKEYTGFLAHYDDGRIIKEQEDFYSKKFKKKCATNWAEIDKKRLVALELVWKGKSKAKIEKQNPTDSHRGDLSPDQWFFSQYGYMDMAKRNITVVARNIGWIKDGIINVTSVNEDTGTITMSTRAR